MLFLGRLAMPGKTILHLSQNGLLIGWEGSLLKYLELHALIYSHISSIYLGLYIGLGSHENNPYKR